MIEEPPGLDRVRTVVLSSRLLAQRGMRGRLQHLRELGVDVVVADGASSRESPSSPHNSPSSSRDHPLALGRLLDSVQGFTVEDLLAGPEPVLVLSFAGDPGASVLGATARVTAVERPRDALPLIDRLIEGQLTFPDPVDDPAWRVELDGFDPYRERDVESWLAVRNGRTGTRGSLEEGSEHSEPGCYVAGVYGWPDREPPGPELVPGPEWTLLAPRVEAEPSVEGG